MNVRKLAAFDATDFSALRSHPVYNWILAASVLAFLLLVFIWHRSLNTIFFAIAGDDFHRTLYAWQVTQGQLVPSDLWPPLQFWIEAALLAVYPHILSVPYLVNLAASTLTLLALAVLGRNLGLSKTAVLVAVALAATTPWFIWLSVAGLAEPLYVLCGVVGYAGLLLWLSRKDERGLWVAAVGLLGAGMLRFDGWGHSLAFSVVVLWLWWRAARPRPWRWLASLAVVWSFPIAWMLWEYALHGDPLYPSSVTRTYWLAVHGTQPLWTRLAWQPQDLWTVGGLAVPCGLVGWWLMRRQPAVPAFAFMWLGSFALLMSSTLNHVITQAEPTRLVVLHTLLLMPSAAWLLAKFAQRHVLGAAAVALLVGWLLLARWDALPTYPKALPDDIAEVGRYVNQLRAEQRLAPNRTVLVEVVFWDYVLLHLLTGEPGAVVYDRPPLLYVTPSGEQMLDDATNPSLLALPLADLQNALRQRRVQIVIARTPRALGNLEPLAREARQIGRWRVVFVE